MMIFKISLSNVTRFFVGGFVGLLNFGCFYFWLVFEMILLQIWWI